MIRDVDLVSYLPPFLAEYKELAATLAAEDPEFGLAWEAADRALRNGFIATADEYGISRFEKMLGILPEPSDALEDRRARVQSRWHYALPYTLRILREKVSEVLGGEHEFSLGTDFAEAYRLTVVIYAVSGVRTDEVERLLSRMVPANVLYDVVLEGAISGTAHFGVAMEEADITEIRQRRAG